MFKIIFIGEVNGLLPVISPIFVILFEKNVGTISTTFYASYRYGKIYYFVVGTATVNCLTAMDVNLRQK